MYVEWNSEEFAFDSQIVLVGCGEDTDKSSSILNRVGQCVGVLLFGLACFHDKEVHDTIACTQGCMHARG